MHILNYNSTGESSFKVYLNTRSTNIIFNNGSNYNNITFYFDTQININDERHEYLISLSNLQLPISWPLISDYLNNNTIEYILNGTTYNYVIPDGSYSALDLKTLLNTNLLMTVIYSKNTGKYSFTHDTYDFTITSNTTCYNELGFYNLNYSSTSLTLTSVKPIDLSGTREVYIRSNLTTKNIDSRSGKTTSNIIDSVPINVNNFDVLKYTNTEGFRTKIKDQNISYINIILEDDEGNEIDIKNNWSITLEFNKIMNDNLTLMDQTEIKNNNNIEDLYQDQIT